MLNKVILMGRLTKEPELRYTQNNVPVCSFSLAVDRGFSRNAAEGQQTVDFINIVAWRNTAEFVSKWFRKGQLVAVSGKLQVRNWKNNDGENRYATEVVADECFFAESPRNEGSAQATTYDFGGNNSYQTDFVAPAAPGTDFEELIGNDGELPFKGEG